MKKAIKHTEKTGTSSSKKSTRPFTAKKDGYKEEVYNAEQQDAYNKSSLSKNDKKNTAAPKD